MNEATISQQSQGEHSSASPLTARKAERSRCNLYVSLAASKESLLEIVQRFPTTKVFIDFLSFSVISNPYVQKQYTGNESKVVSLFVYAL